VTSSPTDQSRADRLRIAAVLLGQGEPAALLSIRKMRAAERAQLTAQINWVRDYEAADMPERTSDTGARIE
jgi:hypothetical protein